MRSLWEIPIAELGASLESDELAEPDPVKRIERLLATYIEFAISNEETHRSLLLFVRPPGSTTDVSNDPDELILFAALRRAIEAGQSSGVVRDGDPRLLAQMLWSGVHGALALPINVDTYRLGDGPTVAAEMVALLIRSITHEETQ